MNLETVCILILCNVLFIVMLLVLNSVVDETEDDKHRQEQLDEIREKLDLILIKQEIKKNDKRKNSDK